MADNRAEAARDFAAFWKDRGYEKGQSQAFWLSLLQVYGVEHLYNSRILVHPNSSGISPN